MRLLKSRLRAHLLLLGSSAIACGDDASTAAADEAAPADEALQASEPVPTFWQNVAPILQEKCAACHQSEGIAPFPLETIEDAERRAMLIADMTESRIMPPYLMETGGACGSFDESAALTEEEIATIGRWARGERAPGTPGVITAPSAPSLADGVDLFTPEFVPEIEGGLLAEFDEYRCFSVDTGLTEDAFVTGFDFEPGNREMVHHVITMLVDPEGPSEVEGLSNAQAIERLRQQEPDPSRDGWHCFGLAGDGVRVQSAPAAWAPGAPPYRFPEGIGARVRPGWQLIVQVHYNLARPEVRGQSDRTRVRLQLQSSVERQAGILLNDAFLSTLGNPIPDVLEPGNPAARYSWTMTGAELGVPPGVPVEVLSVSPHMHERGRKFQIEMGSGGELTCQGRINRWDFDWQRLYDYTTRPTLDAESQLRVTCEYDTSADTAPVLPGWGTRNEMCELTMAIAFPPGVEF